MCEDRISELVDYADGALGDARRPAFEAHLASCEGCRSELASLRRVEDALFETRDEPHDLTLSGFAARTTDRAEAFRDRSARGLFWSTTRAVRWGLGLSAASLALALTLALPRPHGPSRVRAPTAGEPAPMAAVNGAAITDTADDTEDTVLADDASVVTWDSAFDALSTDELDTLDQLLDQNPT